MKITNKWIIIVIFIFALLFAYSLFDKKDDSNNATIIEYYDDGRKKLEMSVDENKNLYGVSRYYYENGKIKKQSFFQDGKEHGRIEIFYDNGNSKCEGLFKEGNRDSIWIWYLNNNMNSVESIESYSKGKLFGGQINYDISGKIKDYKFYNYDGLLGKIAIDNSNIPPKISGKLSFLYFNKTNLKASEPFNSIIFIGKLPNWNSLINIKILDSDGEEYQLDFLDESLNEYNCNKYLWKFSPGVQGNYSLTYFIKLMNENNRLIYEDTLKQSLVFY